MLSHLKALALLESQCLDLTFTELSSFSIFGFESLSISDVYDSMACLQPALQTLSCGLKFTFDDSLITVIISRLQKPKVYLILFKLVSTKFIVLYSK